MGKSMVSGDFPQQNQSIEWSSLGAAGGGIYIYYMVNMGYSWLLVAINAYFDGHFHGEVGMVIDGHWCRLSDA